MATVVRQSGSLRRKVGGRKAVVRNDIETAENQIVTLAMNGRLAKAGRMAIRAQREKGLAVTFKRGTRVIKQYPNGGEEVIDTVTTPDFTLPRGVKIIKR